MILLLALIQRRPSQAGCPCRELCMAGQYPVGSEGGQEAFPISASTQGEVFMGPNLSGEAIPSRPLMFSARLGPLPPNPLSPLCGLFFPDFKSHICIMLWGLRAGSSCDISSLVFQSRQLVLRAAVRNQVRTHPLRRSWQLQPSR